MSAVQLLTADELGAQANQYQLPTHLPIAEPGGRHADHKHMGVGWELLGYIASYAEELGLDAIESIESRENRAAIEVERNMGFTVTTDPNDATLVLVRRELGTRSAG